MKPHALLAALLTHAFTHAAPPVLLPTPAPYVPVSDPFEYDYGADVEAQENILLQGTTVSPEVFHQPPGDPLAEAREMAKLNIMDRILIALGPPFGEKLPIAPNSDTLATVPTPINITTEPCPLKYKRCSSQTYFPSCETPRNASPDIWPQRFNLYFNLTADFESTLDVINATLRLYKNNSLPLQRPKTLLVKAFIYTRSLTRRRNKTKLVADTQIKSDYLGWVTLSVTEMVKRWKKQKNNHGLLITVNDVDDIPWDAPRIFVTMDCASGIVPLPFEVQMEQEGQQYPALNVRLGSPEDEQETLIPSSTSSTTISTSQLLPLPPSSSSYTSFPPFYNSPQSSSSYSSFSHPYHPPPPSSPNLPSNPSATSYHSPSTFFPYPTFRPSSEYASESESASITAQGDDPNFYDYTSNYESDLERQEERERQVEEEEEEEEQATTGRDDSWPFDSVYNGRFMTYSSGGDHVQHQTPQHHYHNNNNNSNNNNNNNYNNNDDNENNDNHHHHHNRQQQHHNHAPPPPPRQSPPPPPPPHQPSPLGLPQTIPASSPPPPQLSHHLSPTTNTTTTSTITTTTTTPQPAPQTNTNTHTRRVIQRRRRKHRNKNRQRRL